MKVSSTLNQLMNIKGISPQKLADETGISIHAINSYKSGRRNPNAQNQLILQKYFNVPPIYFSDINLNDGELTKLKARNMKSGSEVTSEEIYEVFVMEFYSLISGVNGEEREFYFEILNLMFIILNYRIENQSQTNLVNSDLKKILTFMKLLDKPKMKDTYSKLKQHFDKYNFIEDNI